MAEQISEKDVAACNLLPSTVEQCAAALHMLRKEGCAPGAGALFHDHVHVSDRDYSYRVASA